MMKQTKSYVGATAAVIAGVCVFAAVAPAAETMLVCNFGSNSVSRYDVATGARLSDLDAAGNLSGPLCARVGPDGLLYVASEGNNRIVRFDADSGAYVDTFITGGAAVQPTGLTWDAQGNLLVSMFDQSSVVKFNGVTGAFMQTLVTSGQGALGGADNGTIIGPDGELWVPSYFNNRVIRFDGDTGATLGALPGSIGRPRVIEFRGGVAYITSETSNTVRRFNAATLAAMPSLMPAGSGGLLTPIGMAFGPNNVLYVASSGNNRILKYDAGTGAFLGQFADAGAGINLPTFITIVPGPGAAAMGALVCLAAARRRR